MFSEIQAQKLVRLNSDSLGDVEKDEAVDNTSKLVDFKMEYEEE